MKVPDKWNEKWSSYVISEEYATKVAKGLCKVKTFDKFFRHLVNTFGACYPACAAYLWNKMHPEKPRKFIFDA